MYHEVNLTRTAGSSPWAQLELMSNCRRYLSTMGKTALPNLPGPWIRLEPCENCVTGVKINVKCTKIKWNFYAWRTVGGSHQYELSIHVCISNHLIKNCQKFKIFPCLHYCIIKVFSWLKILWHNLLSTRSRVINIWIILNFSIVEKDLISSLNFFESFFLNCK